MKEQTRRTLWWCIDRIYPLVEKPSEKEARSNKQLQEEARRQREVVIAALSADELEACLAATRDLLAKEDARQQGN
jgi:hypothetical protein